MPQLSLGWDEAYARVIEYQSEYGLYPPQGHKSADGFSLVGWVSNQRDYYCRGALSAERQSRLEGLPKLVVEQEIRSRRSKFCVRQQHHGAR